MTQKLTRADKLNLIMSSVKEHTEGYHNSTSVIETDKASIDIKQFMLVCALAGKNLMLSSSTGTGKTTLSRAFGESIFGNNTGFLPIDPSLDENKFRDILFSRMAQGDSLSDAVEVNKTITAPMVVIDEFNRAPAILVSKLHGYLSNGAMTFEGGKEITPGIKLDDGSRYQWKVATINEGENYHGTCAMDKAGVDRFGAVLALDMYPPTSEDKRVIATTGVFTPNNVKTDSEAMSGIQKAFFDLFLETRSIPMDTVATEFWLAVANKDQCYMSPSGTKASVDSFDINSQRFCVGCHASAVYDNVCGAVFAPSIRALDDLKGLAQAFVIVTRSGEDSPKVVIADLLAMSRFALYKKMQIDASWAERVRSDSSFQSIEEAMKRIYTRYLDSLRDLMDIIRKEAKAEKLGDGDLRKVDDAIMKDPSCRSRREILALIRNRQTP